MKICVISNLYPPNARGGAEQVVAKTVEALAAAGHDLVVITTTGSDGDWREQEGGVRVYRFRPGNLYYYTRAEKFPAPVRFIWHLINMFHLGAARRVKQMLQEEKPDVVHTHNLMGLSFLIPRVIKKAGIRHVHTVHDVQLVEPSGIILKSKEHSFRYAGLPTKLYSALTRKLFGSPDVVVAPSQFIYNFYHSRGFFPESDFVMQRNPMTFAMPEQLPEKGSGKRPVFLYVGQIEDHKGVPFLVDAFTGLKDIEADLHIVGGGSLLEKVREQGSGDKRIHIHGRCSRQQVAELFAKADVTIVSSSCYEDSPTVIFESFSFGVPVLASNIEGIAELIEEGENGMTFVADDSESLKEKMRWCASHNSELSAMANAARKALSQVSDGDVTANLLRLYRS